MGSRSKVVSNIDKLVAQVKAAVRAGDHVVCISNCGFGEVHAKLLLAFTV